MAEDKDLDLVTAKMAFPAVAMEPFTTKRTHQCRLNLNRVLPSLNQSVVSCLGTTLPFLSSRPTWTLNRAISSQEVSNKGC